ncbi:MAG: homogentisate 1,2-dioxygenase, partial [Pseudomonadales bacterium]|nr:homogentisate 1,2-dioxygenase [Pseudomonadales bacterium]
MSAKKWVGFPVKEGNISRQAHADLPEGTFERELGREGFFGPVTQMHHKHAPTGWVDWEGPLRPHAFDLNRLFADVESPFDAMTVLENADCEIKVWSLSKDMPDLARNSDGDQLLFVHEGSGEFFCDYGHISVSEGDYVVIPRGTAWRIEVQDRLRVYDIQNTDGAYMLPDRGLLGPNALFDPATLQHPRIDDAFVRQQTEDRWRIRVKRAGQVSTVTYPFNPLD